MVVWTQKCNSCMLPDTTEKFVIYTWCMHIFDWCHMAFLFLWQMAICFMSHLTFSTAVRNSSNRYIAKMESLQILLMFLWRYDIWPLFHMGCCVSKLTSWTTRSVFLLLVHVHIITAFVIRTSWLRSWTDGFIVHSVAPSSFIISILRWEWCWSWSTWYGCKLYRTVIINGLSGLN